MSLRAKIVASFAIATSAFLLVPAAAQAATHPVQLTGAKLKSALLPASAFGSGFTLAVASSSGKSLWHQKAKNHVPTMSCGNFESEGLTRYGESAVAISVSLNKNALSGTSLSNLDLFYEQAVYQFPSAKAAATFYNQAHAKYASCKSFNENFFGNADGGGTKVVLKSIAKTKVGKYRAFQLTQSAGDSGISGLSLKLNTLVTVEGADVFIVTNFNMTNHPVSAKTMLKLVGRVMKLG
jgi:hypothetical protein